MKTLVYIDHFKGEVQQASWEALGVGKSLGSASAVVLGANLDAVAKAAFEFGADEVLVADDAALQDYRPETFAGTLAGVISSESPDAVLFPTTSRTRELAAMVAVDLKTGVLVDLTGFNPHAHAPMTAGGRGPRVIARLAANTRLDRIINRNVRYKLRFVIF